MSRFASTDFLDTVKKTAFTQFATTIPERPGGPLGSTNTSDATKYYVILYDFSIALLQELRLQVSVRSAGHRLVAFRSPNSVEMG